MKQLKFLKTITCDNIPAWYENCTYEVVDEGAGEQGRTIYKLFCEDFKLRGIDSKLKDIFFKVIEIEDKKEEKKIEIKEKKPTKKNTKKPKKSTKN